MTCYQSTSLPSGVTSTGRTGYATEADCLNACKEGACCTGTTCSVKPQCQCQGTGQTFKGIGTVCTGTSCCGSASGCLCYCTANGGSVPQYLNITISAEWTGSASCNWSASDTITLTRNASYPIDSPGVGETFCHQYIFANDLVGNGFIIQAVTSKGTSHETMSIIWTVLNKTCPTYFRSGSTRNTSHNGGFQSTTSPGNGSGVCWSQHVNFEAEETAVYGPGSLMPHVGTVLVRVKVNGLS